MQIKTEIKQYMETNGNNNSTMQNLWDTDKLVLRGRYTAIQAYLRKEQQSHMSSLNSQLTNLEKEEQMRPKVSRRRNIRKMRAGINTIEKNKTIQRINESRSWFFEKIKKVDKPLARLIRKKRESAHRKQKQK